MNIEYAILGENITHKWLLSFFSSWLNFLVLWKLTSDNFIISCTCQHISLYVILLLVIKRLQTIQSCYNFLQNKTQWELFQMKLLSLNIYWQKCCYHCSNKIEDQNLQCIFKRNSQTDEPWKQILFIVRQVICGWKWVLGCRSAFQSQLQTLHSEWLFSSIQYMQ